MPKRSANEISLDESQFPPGWSILDEAMLQATCAAEAKVWRMVERMYGISAFELLPADEVWDLTALTKEPKIKHLVTGVIFDNTNWNAQFFAGQRGLSIFRHAIKLAKWCRQKKGIEIDGSDFLLSPRPMLQVLEDGEVEPDYLDFLDKLEEASYIGNKEKTGVSGGIIYRDFVIVENAWECYVQANPRFLLSLLRAYQATLKRKEKGFDQQETLDWKRGAILHKRREAGVINRERDDDEEENVREQVEVKEEVEEGVEGGGGG